MTERIAIVGVHGVADQKPGETAETILRILQTGRHATTSEGFTPVRLAIPVEKLAPPESEAIADQVATEDASVAFICEQTRRYDPQSRPDDAVYETVCFRGDVRIDDKSVPVDVYELHWADLSRLSSGFWNLFQEFYQLLFHLGSLGRRTLETPDPPNDGSAKAHAPTSKLFSGLHGIALVLLCEAIPVLNLLLFAVLSLMVPAKFEQLLAVTGTSSSVHQSLAVGGVGLLAALAALATLFSSQGTALGVGTQMLLRRTGGMALGVIAFSWLIRTEFADVLRQKGVVDAAWMVWGHSILTRPVEPSRLFALVWIAAVIAGLTWLLRGFAARKPSVAPLSICAGGIVGGLLLAEWTLLRATPAGTLTATMRTAWVVHVGLKACWMVLAIAAVLLVVLYPIELWRAAARRDRARGRAATTVLASLVIPLNLFAIVTMLVYGVAYGVGMSFEATRPPDDSFSLWTPYGRHETTAAALLRDMLVGSGSSMAYLVVVFWGLAVLSSLQAFFWAGWCEATRPLERMAGKSAAVEQLSVALGAALTRGYRRLIGPIFWLILALPFAGAAGRAWDVLHHPRVPNAAMADITFDALGLVPKSFRMGGSSAGHGPIATTSRAAVQIEAAPVDDSQPAPGMLWLSALGILLLWVGRLDWVAQRLWPILDVALDVDNYLRERPWHSNPKARIATRYAALLRFLALQTDPRDPDGCRYGRVIFVAHSQGTVITADVLRFLTKVPDARLARLGLGGNTKTAGSTRPALCLLTVGTPLRQLYGWRFPNLYWWARHDGAGDGAAGTAEQPIARTCRPNPDEFSLRAWINAYGAADYVGRSLWRNDEGENIDWIYRPWHERPDRESRDDHGEGRWRRRELCLGPSAHMRYFDDHAHELRTLIADLARLPVVQGDRGTGHEPATLSNLTDSPRDLLRKAS